MPRGIFQDQQALCFYDNGKKFPRLHFEAGDEPIRAERINDWLAKLEMALSDRMKKIHPGSPMTGMLTKAPLLWGAHPNGNVDWTGDLSIPGSLEQFAQWRAAGRYDGFARLEVLAINEGVTDFEDLSDSDGNVTLTAAQQQDRFIQTFFPYHPRDMFGQIFARDRYTGDALTFKSPRTQMLECLRCIGPVILKTVEPNSRNSVVQGDAANLEEYTRAMKEQHCRVGGLRDTV
jgi:hypothetical protein